MPLLLREKTEHSFRFGDETYTFQLETAGRLGSWRRDGYLVGINEHLIGHELEANEVVELSKEQRLQRAVHRYEGAALAGTLSKLTKSAPDGNVVDIDFDHATFEELPDMWVDLLVTESYRLNPHWSFGGSADADPKATAEETPTG